MDWLRSAGRWLHPRWGQMLCFWVGGLVMTPAVVQPNDDFTRRGLVVRSALVAIGLALKGLAILKAATIPGR